MGPRAFADRAMIFDVSHRTTYTYRKPVLQSEHLVHLAPRQSPRQRVLRHSLLVEPAPSSNIAVADYFGNATTILAIDDEHSELVAHARSTVEVKAPDLPMLALSTPWEQVAGKAKRDEELDIPVLQFVSASAHTRLLRQALDYARRSFPPNRPILEAALDLTRRIHADFTFDTTATDISTPVSHVLQERRGVCQDFAHLELTCLRGLGLPARYVIHAVGPVWSSKRQPECDQLLASCYRTSLALASRHGVASIAFPAISTGVYAFPADRAARIAVETVSAELGRATGVRHVVFCCFSRDAARHHEDALRALGLGGVL